MRCWARTKSSCDSLMGLVLWTLLNKGGRILTQPRLDTARRALDDGARERSIGPRLPGGTHDAPLRYADHRSRAQSAADRPRREQAETRFVGNDDEVRHGEA